MLPPAFLAAASAAFFSLSAPAENIWLDRPAGLVAGFDFSGHRTTSPTGHSGTLVGNASVVDGTRYLSLDGNGDLMSIADAPEFSFTLAGQDHPWSFAAWVYLSSHTANHYVAIKGSEFQITLGHSGAIHRGLTAILYNSAFTAYIGRRQGANTGIAVGGWTHIGVSYSGSESNTGILLYVNGSNVAGSGISGGSYTGTSNTPASVDIGSGGPVQDASRYTQIRFYNRVLAPSEFAQLYNHGSALQAQGGTP